MKKFAIVVAAGTGQRIQSKTPKQFCEINGKPLFVYCLYRFFSTFPDIQVVLVIPKNYKDSVEAYLTAFFPKKKISIAYGGEQRYHSVLNGLNCLKHEKGLVAIHDSARPFVSSTLISNLYTKALQSKTAVPVIAPSDSTIIFNTKKGWMHQDRNKIRLKQTPQVFDIELLRKAYEAGYSKDITDDASLVEKMGISIEYIEGEIENTKVTYSNDLLLAEHKLNQGYTQ